jgi:hypothetical protein
MDWYQILTLVISMFAAAYYVVSHTNNLVSTFKADLREDQKEDRQRWGALFEKFHILDKDVEKFRVRRK